MRTFRYKQITHYYFSHTYVLIENNTTNHCKKEKNSNDTQHINKHTQYVYNVAQDFCNHDLFYYSKNTMQR